ncbi:MAG: membrane protein insertion efficiency factor YidD [Candidatus Omnitrophota bacterium]
MKTIAVNAINFYRNYISKMKLPSCRFYPTCSKYALDAIEKRGFAAGAILSLKRILRCHPLSKGGYDPVE